MAGLPPVRTRDRLCDRLARACGRPVDVVALEAAQAAPLMLDAALRDGRVLVDRDGEWPALLADRPRIARDSAHAARRLRTELHALVSELSHDA
jgi:hypothetical protein